MVELQAGCLVRALFDYTAVTPGEISFSIGDTFHYCASDPRGWAKGEIKGKRGWFPISYVEPVAPRIPPSVPTRRSIASDSLERGSIIEEKQKIASLLDSWLPSRISIHEDEIGTSISKETSKRHMLFHKIIGTKNRRPVFAVTLAELQKNGRDVPLLVIQLIAHLSQENRLATEGIFRVPGNKDKINKLNSDFKDANETADLSKNPGTHTVACVLKGFFQQLPEAVVPTVFTESMLKVFGDTTDTKKRVSFFTEIINRMPSTNATTFNLLLKFLYKVSLRSDENQMTPRNLGIVWGPTTMRPPHSDTASMMSTNETCSAIIEFMIEHWPELLENLKN